MFIRRQCLWLEGVDKVDCGFRGAEVVMALVGADFLSAVGAAVDVVPRVDPSDTYLGLKVPPAVENPGVAVGYARSDHPSLVTLVGQFGEIGAEKLDVVVEIAEIVLSAEHVGADKVAGETLAEPVAAFGHQEPVAPVVAVDGPCVELSVGLDSPFRSESELDADIGRQHHVVKDIGLDGGFLRAGMDASGQTDHDQ